MSSLRFGICFSLTLCAGVASAQIAASSTVVGAGYALPAPVYVAPGQVLTFFVQGVGAKLNGSTRAPDAADLPTSPAAVSVLLNDHAIPIFEVRSITTCGLPFVQPVFPNRPAQADR